MEHYCSIRWIVEILKTKKTKTKLLSFYKQQSYFSQIVSKKAQITISFFMKNSNRVLVFSSIYLVFYKIATFGILILAQGPCRP